jgi:hypothetical protein
MYNRSRSHLLGDLVGTPSSLVLPALQAERQSSSSPCDLVHREEGGRDGRPGSSATMATSGTSVCTTSGAMELVHICSH